MTIQFPQRFGDKAAPGSLLKHLGGIARVRATETAKDADYLAMVRECACIRCGLEGKDVEAAHIRMNSAALGKRQAMGKKPSDNFCLPLCSSCHTRDPDSQHRLGEAIFWHILGINPLIVCQALHSKRGDIPAMRAIIFNAIAEREAVSQFRGIGKLVPK